MIVVLLGPPGAGKGTQGERIAAALGVPKISTGDVLRAADRRAARRSASRPRPRTTAATSCPTTSSSASSARRSPRREQARGVMLDGVVRTVPQAEGLAGVLAALGRTLDVVLLFEIPDELLVARLSARTVCDACQMTVLGPAAGPGPCRVREVPKGTLMRRKDDEPDAVRNRLRVYQAQTAPVIAWYARARREHRAHRRRRHDGRGRRPRPTRPSDSADGPAQVAAGDRDDGRGRADPRGDAPARARGGPRPA